MPAHRPRTELAALELHAAFDVVFAHLADLAGGQVAERREVVQAQGHGCIARAEAAPAGQHDGERQGQMPEAAFQGSGERGHGELLAVRSARALARLPLPARQTLRPTARNQAGPALTSRYEKARPIVRPRLRWGTHVRSRAAPERSPIASLACSAGAASISARRRM